MKLCKLPGCENRRKSLGWCNMHYMRWRRHGDPEKTAPRPPYDPEEAFERFSIPEPNSGCLLWEGSPDKDGYGELRGGGLREKAHRYAWTRANGPIPEGMEIDHKCHTPQCVNIDHLRIVTPDQNKFNRRGAQKNNKSTGVRNVYPTRGGKFMVVVLRRYYGQFDSLDEAQAVAVETRRQISSGIQG